MITTAAAGQDEFEPPEVDVPCDLQAVDETWQRALAVVAHPDDLEFGAAAAVARWTDQAKQVVYCLVTSGEAGIDGMEPERAGPLREDEQRASARLVGVDRVDFLGFPDGVLEEDLTLRRAIAREVRRHRPDVVLTNNFRETWDGATTLNQADHIATAWPQGADRFRRAVGRTPYGASVSEMTIVGETAAGVYRRTITAARPLRDGDIGSGAEDATRASAAIWGLPDFVFRSVVTATGSGVRERGDALLVVGEIGADVQVKARAVEPRDDHAERRWLDKVITKAAKQAAGTVRSITREPCTLTNERGRELLIDGPAIDWQPVIVIDHPSPPDEYIPDTGQALVLLRRDWEFLFEQLKSTDQVLRYVKRVRSHDQLQLGHEPIRYYELAAADEAAPPDELDPRYLPPGSTRLSHPLLPYAPAGHESEEEHVPLRVLMEDVARSSLPEGVHEGDRVQMLAAIDATPVAYRRQLGADLMRWLEECSRVTDPEQWMWRSRNLRIPSRPSLIFSATTRFNELTLSSFRSLVMLRHQEWHEAVPEAQSLTVGLLITPSLQGRSWDTTMVALRGQIEYEGEERQAAEALWNKADDRS